LAIHYLNNDMKLKLFQRIRKSLCEGGGFWNANRTIPKSHYLAEVYKPVREEWVTQHETTLAAQLLTDTPVKSNLLP
jgi:tRNA (cmo5U34)-methyltransferase